MVQKKPKIDFQDGRHLEFLMGTILVIFGLPVTPMLPTKFQVSLAFWFKRRSEKYHGGHLGFLIGTILAPRPTATAIRGMLNHNFVDANFLKYCMGEMGKKKNTSPFWFSLTQNASPLSGCIQNLKTRALIACEKSVMDFYEKERKMDK